jgi:predicted nucleotide-binding protein (sugar kinase/HSP70/actin superfamily)
MQIGYTPKVSFKITYWKSIYVGDGVTMDIIPKQEYAYTSESKYKDKLLDWIKETGMSYRIIEIQEKLIEQGE